MLGHCSCHSAEELSVGIHAGHVGAAGCLPAVAAAAAAVSVSACATAPMAATAAAAAFGSPHSHYISSVVPEVVWCRELPHKRQTLATAYSCSHEWMAGRRSELLWVGPRSSLLLSEAC